MHPKKDPSGLVDRALLEGAPLNYEVALYIKVPFEVLKLVRHSYKKEP